LIAAFGASDRMSNSDALSTGADFSIDGSQTGVGVAPAAVRQVWYLLDTPLATSTTAQQTINVTITANEP
jgi:hypothetical protein